MNRAMTTVVTLRMVTIMLGVNVSSMHDFLCVPEKGLFMAVSRPGEVYKEHRENQRFGDKAFHRRLCCMTRTSGVKGCTAYSGYFQLMSITEISLPVIF
jgi:hypothetical protein